MIAAMLGAALIQQAPLGRIDVVVGKIKIVRAASKKEETDTKANHRIGLWPGDKVVIPSGAGIKGVYDGDIVLLPGPVSWVAPQKGSFSGPQAGRRLLGRTDMGGPPELTTIFAPLIDSPHRMPDFYVDSYGNLDIAWIAPKGVQFVYVSATVDGKSLGPYRHTAHVDGFSGNLGWMEDNELGTRLRREFMQESEKVPIQLRFHPLAGQDFVADGFLVSRATARDLDSLVTALKDDLNKADVESSRWYEDWNALLVATEDGPTASSSYWTVRLGDKLPHETCLQDLIHGLLTKE